MILLNPGPVNISERVRGALNRPDICHREPEFTELQHTIREKLLSVYGLLDEWAAVLLTGSGTAAMEAMLTSFAVDNTHFLIIENGVYGERLEKISTIHGIRHTTLAHAWGESIDLERLRNKLSKDISAIVMVHHETTTGRLNDIESVAKIAAEYGVPILLDGVSSFGAEELRFREWNIAACAATANKCLHAVPGISFVIANRDKLKQCKSDPKTLYLDLSSYLMQQDTGGTPFTQSVQVMYALNEALAEHTDSGGWQSRRGDYREKMALLEKGMSALGIKPLLEEGVSSCVLKSFYLPGNTGYQKFHDSLKDAGFVIYSGQGKLAEKIFRVSLMGNITGDDTRRFIDAVKQVTG